MKKIIVNENCIGCGACVAIDPKHFDFNDEGLSRAISNENLDAKELQEAIEACPMSAISISDACDNEACECEDCACEDCDCGNEACECEDCTCEDCDCGNEACECEGCHKEEE